jgi:CubicO group peptidase (beta-lactamase class C family)
VARAVGADHRDAARTMAWGQLDTTVRMVAATKAMTILALLLSIDRGHIDVDARVTGENSPMPAKMS